MRSRASFAAERARERLPATPPGKSRGAPTNTSCNIHVGREQHETGIGRVRRSPRAPRSMRENWLIEKHGHRAPSAVSHRRRRGRCLTAPRVVSKEPNALQLECSLRGSDFSDLERAVPRFVQNSVRSDAPISLPVARRWRLTARAQTVSPSPSEISSRRGNVTRLAGSSLRDTLTRSR